MGKITWKPGTMEYPLPAVLVSCGDEAKANVLTIAWTGIICTDPAMTYVSIRKERYSYDIIKEKKEFVINLTTKDLAYATDKAGVKSGKDVDKFALLNLTREKASIVSCPMIKESPVSIECKVEEVKELGSHDMFIAKIVAVNVDEKYLDKTGKFDLEKCNLIAYSHGNYYTLGENLGKFGFSVKK
ncbi:MAG: flavin reductase family protein [Clostridia bacterium]|nr:flavin reductase family protein [Clostridia bacterium]